jgi:hypothetical protein
MSRLIANDNVTSFLRVVHILRGRYGKPAMDLVDA